MDEKKDIFDRLMHLPGLRSLEPFYRKYKEQLLYVFFGGLAFLVNLFAFWLSEKVMPPLWANVIAWIAGVLFAFATNRSLVFQSKVRSARGVAKELLVFSTGRLATLGLEELLLWIGIELLGFGSMPVKLVAQVAVLIGNYVISKWIVFRSK